MNLHPLDLLDPELFHPEAPLSLAAARVVLELTERAATSGIPELGERLQLLRRLGFRLAVDDLGAGHGNLSLLAELRPDFLKVDMSLVRSLDRDRSRRCAVRHLLALADELEATAVAEGAPASRKLAAHLGTAQVARPARPTAHHVMYSRAPSCGSSTSAAAARRRRAPWASICTLTRGWTSSAI